MLVVDAGCLFEALIGTPVGQLVKRHLREDEDHAAPHVVDVETLNVIRRYHLDGRLDDTAARQAVEDLELGPVSDSPTPASSRGHGTCGTTSEAGTPSMLRSQKRSTPPC